MIIDLRKPYQWDEINQTIKASLQFEGSVKIFQSMSQAIFELAMSIQSLYVHKKQFYHSLGLGTHADEGLLFLARQGIKGIEFSAEVPPVIEDKKTLFWICDQDDAITGQLYHNPLTSQLDPKVFRIWISHRRHFSLAPTQTISENDIHIYGSNSNGPVVVHLGRRAQSLQMLLAPTLKWDGYANFSSFSPIQENKTWVQTVEQGKWAGGENLLSLQVDRIYDRALLVWKNRDAGAIREILIKQNQLPPQQLEVVGLNRWNEAKLIAQFEKRGWSAEVFRGLLLISAELAQNSSFQAQLEKAILELDALSQF